MNWRSPRIWIGICSTGLVGLLLVGDFFRKAPGPLSAVHAQVEDLNGLGSCSACHGGLFGSMTESCLECHEPIADQLENATGLHGSLDAPRQCATCHSEHHGSEFRPVHRRSFELAAAGDGSSFDHSRIGFEMAGRHLEQDCAACHQHAATPVLPVGERRFLGLTQDCATCHDDPHQGRMALGCAQCHGQHRFDQLEPHDHDRVLSLEGGHAELACTTCHEPGSRHDLERLGRRADRPARTCADCHDSPHRTTVDAVGCTSCHAIDDAEAFASATRRMARHHTEAIAGFDLTPPHAEAACTECHRPAEPTFAARHPGRDSDSCQACHESPHGDQFSVAASYANAPTQCVDCHDRQRFDPPAFGATEHARTALALTDRHAELECKHCHVRPEPAAPRQFRGTPNRCGGCHEDAHDSFFTRRWLAERPATPASETKPLDCNRCHRPTRFADVPDDRFDHGHWTGFALGGAHAESPDGCATCHHQRPERDFTGRRFGTVHESFGEYRGCVTCHQDPHRGVFDRRGVPARVDGRQDCARCHVESSFRVLAHGFDHGHWTGFALRGTHRRVDCTECHTETDSSPSNHRGWPAPRGTTCAECHSDPHGGQFDEAGRTNDCARCHQDGTAFDDLRFDHDRDTRFPLGEQHESVRCSECHRTDPALGKEITRYRGTPSQCAGCHGHADRVFRRRRR